MEIAGFNVRRITEAQLKDPELLARFQEKYNWFTQMRGVVINEALKIENSLTIVLLHFLVHTDYRRHRLLRTLIFEAEFCSFIQKRKMLSMIFDLFSDSLTCLSKEEAKQLRRDINNLILHRDMFAHGRIIIDGKTEKVFVEYYRGGPTETEVTEEFLQKFKKSATAIQEKLRVLNEFFRENEFTEDFGKES